MYLIIFFTPSMLRFFCQRPPISVQNNKASDIVKYSGDTRTKLTFLEASSVHLVLLKFQAAGFFFWILLLANISNKETFKDVCRLDVLMCRTWGIILYRCCSLLWDRERGLQQLARLKFMQSLASISFFVLITFSKDVNGWCAGLVCPNTTDCCKMRKSQVCAQT